VYGPPPSSPPPSGPPPGGYGSGGYPPPPPGGYGPGGYGPGGYGPSGYGPGGYGPGGYGPPAGGAPFGPPPRRRRRRGGLFAFLVLVVTAGLIAAVAVFVLHGKSGCGTGGVTLRVVTSPEKAGLMTQFARDYSGRSVGGTCVQVAVQTKSSGEAMVALSRGWNVQADGGEQPDVWSPASSTWVGLLRQRLGSGGGNLLPAGSSPGIAVAPLVIAMPRPMAQALGWPDKALGWDDILKLSRNPRGWGAYGHPEWGPFRLGKTNPNFSTSGLNATVGTYFAATQKSDSLTTGDIGRTDVQAYVRGVESSIVHYGDTTLTFLQGLQRADDAGQGLSYVSAVAIEEMSVWSYNQGNPTGDPALAGKHAPPKTPLVAIYPKEGTLVSDHPYVVLGTSGKQKYAADFLTYLRGAKAQRQFEAQAFRSYDNRPAPVTTQANGLLPDQPKKMIAPPAPAVLDRVLRSWEALRKRSNVLIVVDVSGSMADPGGNGKSKMDLAKAGLAKAMDGFIDVDRVGLWEFATKLNGNADYKELAPIAAMGESGHRSLLKSRIGALVPRSDTALYGTTLAAYQQVKSHLEPGAINSVLVMTDGKNDTPNSPSISLGQLQSKLDPASGVRIFTVGYGKDADQDVLKKIAAATDAASYNAADPITLDKVLAAVTSNF
jgi:Ca-activated chloride channel homolog